MRRGVYPTLTAARVHGSAGRLRPGRVRRGWLRCDEFHRERVYTMAGVGRGEPFTQENVAKMAAAVGALDLDSHAVRVGQPVHCSRYLLVERRPSTVSVELIVGTI